MHKYQRNYEIFFKLLVRWRELPEAKNQNLLNLKSCKFFIYITYVSEVRVGF